MEVDATKVTKPPLNPATR